jgi:hypothetical protein
VREKEKERLAVDDKNKNNARERETYSNKGSREKDHGEVGYLLHLMKSLLIFTCKVVQNEQVYIPLSD